MGLGAEQGLRQPLAIIFGFGFIALFASVGALGIAAAVFIASVLALPSFSRLKTLLPLELPFAIFLIFIAWAWASSSWSPYPKSDQAWKMALGLPVYCLFAYSVWSLRGKARLWALYAAFSGLMVLFFVYTLEAITGVISGLFAEGNAREQMLRDATRGVSALVCVTPVAWAFVAMLVPGWRGIAAGILLALLAGFVSWKLGLSAGVVAIGFGAILFGIGWLFPRTTILVVGLIAVGMLMLAPMGIPLVLGLLDTNELPATWDVRVQIWQIASERIAQKPLFGWGLDASRAFTDLYVARGVDVQFRAAHPHNIGLQIWLETGLVGVLLFSAAALALAVRVANSWNLTRSQGAAIAASAGVILIFGMVTYGAWQEWFWACTAWVAAMCFLVGPEPEKRAEL